MSLTIEINGNKYEAAQGETILTVLNRNGIKVPTLCHMKDFVPTGACRMCVVELEGNGKLVSSCSFPISDGMKIRTHSPKVVEARKTIVELLLSNHPDDCLYCIRNSNCELQSLSKEYHVVDRRIRGVKNNHKMDHSSLSITRDPDKCILCGRCVRVCEETMGVSCIEYINRGSKTVIGATMNKGLNTSSCVNCGRCVMVCPTGALSERNQTAEVQNMLYQTEKTVVVQYAPSISVSLAEEFGMKPGQDINGILNAALRKMGFKYVFDTTYGADLTIMEESAELIDRIVKGKTLPMFTSCCPAWVKYAEEFAPDFIKNLSSCKSPQQMTGAIIKNYFAQQVNLKPQDIISVSIMPCTAKKFEAQRDTMGREGYNDVDVVLTTRELIELIKLYGIDMHQIEPQLTDSPMGVRSTAGKIFGASGGVMEAALRTAYKTLTGNELTNFKITAVRGLKGRKEAKIKINDLELGVAVVSGLANAGELVEEIRNGRTDIHFIEVMTCPGGCIAGGGQRIGIDESVIEARMKSLYEIDDKESLKVSHKNPEIIELYDKFLGEPLGHKSHELLHTHYIKREVLL
ncbi:MAG: ferredoxin [Bacteroidetes bacterium GWF2_43_63]|nr:MAG: ferredoxin [Bacteroidetes bacterium GWE2_42_42]OFY53657.1 MAG: ferredoxin [Bacteroidetes bacterium GWF2_43_63]HBG71001.1 ferredoxin [Bacteroidales bacterium]HCB62908.1 ferredoxin [Bacteroidales bacterium]HCY24328.1 ferredoxin [Bacteroidales bacterium]